MTDTGLFERADYLAELRSRFEQATNRDGQTVMLGGEAGSGKTSLVRALIESLPDSVTIRTVSCDAAGILGPLGPIFDIADSFGSRIREAAARDAAVDRVTRLILNELRAADGANLLIAEDVHWADQATLDVLRFLARRLDRSQTLLIATFRDDTLDPQHELRFLLGELTNQPNIARMSLPPLSLAAVTEMTAGSGNDPKALHELTGGNPFFVAEILNAGGGSIPQSIRDVVLARTARLDPESRAVLDLASVLGPTIDIRLLRTVWKGDIAVELERSIHTGLLRSSSEGIAFRHAITREIILEELSAPRRADFAQRILAALEADSSRVRNVALLAHFADAADDVDAVGRYAVAAAQAAAAQGAHRQAALQYDRALRFSGGLPDGEIAGLLEARSYELHVTSQNTRSLEDISKAIAIRAKLGDDLLLGDDLRRRSRYHWIAARGHEAEADAIAALAALDTGAPTVELAMACSNLSQLRMLSQMSDESIAWGERAIELATALDAPHVLVHAMMNVGTSRLQMDGSGLEMLEEAAALARQLGLHDDVSRSYTNRTFLMLQRLELEQVKLLARAGIDYTDEHDIFSLNQYLQALYAAAQMEAGEYGPAQLALEQLLQFPHLLAPTRIVCLTTLGLLRIRRGDDATMLLSEALSLAVDTHEAQRLGPVHAARAEAAWLMNDLPTALAEARAGFDRSISAQDQWLNGLLGMWIVRAGGEFGSDALTADPYALEIAGDYGAAAELWHSHGLPVQEARARAASGDIVQLRNALDILLAVDARPDAARVSQALRRLGVSSVPKGPHSRTRDNPAMLTTRELEVLHLLSQGMTNREIAETLYISTRTCGHHVAAIFEKLGVHSRSEAKARAAALGLE